MEKSGITGNSMGVVFIVDISGYSQFIRSIDPSDGMEVIGRLFKAIISANRVSFRISEIEGDAVLFYRFGRPPAIKEILDQFSIILQRFRRAIDKYEKQFPSVSMLNLKAILHYGEMKEFKVHRFNKLYGNILVDAHRLLKNSVSNNTYVLATKQYLDEVTDHPGGYVAPMGIYQCDLYDVGSLCYTYFPFKEGQNELGSPNFTSAL